MEMVAQGHPLEATEEGQVVRQVEEGAAAIMLQLLPAVLGDSGASESLVGR